VKNPPEILGRIAESALARVAKTKEILPFEQIRDQVRKLINKQCNSVNPAVKNKSFKSAIASAGLSFICEVKKASPSKGIIAEDFPWMEIAKEYEDAGAAAISVLTEPEFFMGSDIYLRGISASVKIPTLRKDFIIDPYQLYEAKLWGADAVLLICALLEPHTLEEFLSAADELNLDCLVEIHNEMEAEEAVSAGSRIIGINNRDLATFKIDTGLTSRLRKFIPADALTVAESGIKYADDIRELKCAGVDAVLIGESLMRSADKKKLLRELLSA